MNEYFESIIKRFNKIADIYVEKYDRGKLIIEKDVAVAIVLDELNSYEKEYWKSISKNKYPKNKFGETSRPVLVRYKDKTSDPEVCSYDFTTQKFMSADRDVTKFVKQWCEIPGSEYAGLFEWSSVEERK